MTLTKMAGFMPGIILIGLALTVPVSANPFVGFQPDTMGITANGTFRTPAITITGADGITEINVQIAIPQGITISTAVNSGNLTCVAKGSSATGLFFSEWDPIARTISITCQLTPGATDEAVRYIQFSTSASAAFCQIDLSGSVTGGTGTALFGSLAISPPHAISLVSCTATPAQVESSGTTNCGVSATDSFGHTPIYAWSDVGAGGAFLPSASVANPTYTAPANLTGSNMTIELRCVISCPQNASVTTTASVNLTVRPVPPNTIAVTSSPNPSASIAFSPTPDAASLASPRTAPVTLSYAAGAQGIQITAAKQDGAASPLWFDHLTVDGVDQPQAQRTVTLNVSSTNHTIVAVYAGPVGDINGDGHVNKADAQIILRALLAGSPSNPLYDVDLSGSVDINDARWIMVHRR